ncbi:IS4 family transposase [Ancylomarina euxinus]|uniref:IS4 family transposase n=1 Tax=Ancylomarina euxinus TaxID=2283627 RepID=A0A425XWQ1_9BACT|nr:IS4 family transposase [Ancylomarina euxinus]MCZ4696353.1 IS4 family transposase [Ancylomarina euxinus]MUP16746.1 IS4 family transposase [Ancylomarina euxinus]RRG19066.1 IS4 family transposase [Ancylomarina euxinus]
MYQLPEVVRQVSASAFCQCRDKIKYTAFQEIFHQLTDQFYCNYQHKRFHGYRVVAIDGSIYTVPKTKETVKEFGHNILSETGKWIKAQVSFATDVLNNICIDAIIGAYKENERVHAAQMLDNLGSDNLLLFDRGYYTFDLLRMVLLSENQCCFRLKKNACKAVMNFIKSDYQDIISVINIDGQDYKIRFTKLRLDTGEEEYLCSSLLDMNKFTPNIMKDIYKLRWGVEEQFKDMKHAISVENFVGKKVNSIKQEFFGNILTYNLAMMTCKPQIERLANSRTKKYKYAINKRALLGKIKQCYIMLFDKMGRAKETITELMVIVSKESAPIRRGRKFERSKTFKAKRKYCTAHVSVN